MGETTSVRGHGLWSPPEFGSGYALVSSSFYIQETLVAFEQDLCNSFVFSAGPDRSSSVAHSQACLVSPLAHPGLPAASNPALAPMPWMPGEWLL